MKPPRIAETNRFYEIMKHKERMMWAVVLISIVVWNVVRDDSSPTIDAAKSDVASARHGNRQRDKISAQDQRKRQSMARDFNGSDLDSRSMATLQSPDPLRRMSGFLEILASCDAGNIDSVTAIFSQLQASGISLPEEENLLNYRAGQLKGAELLEGRNGSNGDLEEVGKLRKQYEGWMRTDAIAAGRWLDGLQEGKYRDQMAIVRIACSAKDDPAAALDLAATLHPSQQSIAGKIAAERLAASESFEECSELIRTLGAAGRQEDARYMESLFSSLAKTASNRDATVALTLVQKHIDQPYVSAAILNRISSANAKTNPKEALEWAASVEARRSDLPQGTMVDATIRGMSQEGLDIAEQWAAVQEQPQALIESIRKRRDALEERGEDANEYDKDD